MDPLTFKSSPAESGKTGLSSTTQTALNLGGLFLLAVVVQIIGFKRISGPYDEFLSLYGADRVLHGGLPYRDFWTMYGPAQFYAIALFFKLFGISALTGRIYDALIRAGIACACYSLARLLTGPRWAFAAFAAVILWLTGIYYPSYNFPVYPAMLASLVSCLFFARFLRESSNKRSLFLAGLFVSVAAIFRHDSGFYICFAELLMLVWTARRRRPGQTRQNQFATVGRRLLLYLTAVVLIAGPVYGIIVFKAGVQNVFYDLFYVPAVIYPKVRRLPFLTPETLQLLRQPFSWDGRTAVESLIVFFPIFAILSAFLSLFTSRRSRIFPTTWQRQTFSLLLLLASLFFVKGMIRVGPVQLIQSIIVCLTVLAILFGHLRQVSRPVAVSLYVTALFLALCTAPMLSHILTFGRRNLRDTIHPQAYDSFYRRCHPPAALSRARCILIDPDDLLAVQEIERRSTPDQPIYVGNGRHDRIFWNDVRLYFLAGRGSITRWYDLHPGVQTTLPIQNQIIDAMGRENPPVIAINSTWDNNIEPNQSRYSSGVTALDDYIRSHYTAQAAYGKITILTPSH
ncbi:ArnT family glycosyltransferase [Edaphobacter modestus]|uniref:Dolichyl-phosphate-mannose-protein mannosyltransferase n=1 Tax=Edaphobacter modestus TaxID=388466 RepID=A0A4Q7YXZ7_9BACT|nr:glycosyltransferase family 39 protein [Edaphobacter modestus]RZU41979.1 dolichyl-phosphate-mannose-protein mannosyltransferase [Edaphobacter modestus]